MKKILLVAILSVMALAEATAHQLTPSEALGRLQNVYMSKGRSKAQAKAVTSDYKLVYTSESEGYNTYYAFNRGTDGGFIVLSADDCLPAILMESDDADTFDTDNMPDGMKWWLSQYDQAVRRNAASGKAYVNLSSYDEILPLLETKGMKTAWSQDEPYNNLCPSYSSIKGITGCVATAMAQIMRYYQYPSQGRGEITYTYNFELKGDAYNLSIPKGIRSDLSTHTYDWANMLDSYKKNEYTNEQANAVAQLMYDCGVAVNMTYGNSGSGAHKEKVASSMVDNFGYDASLTYQSRFLYSDEEWENILYSELQAGRPIFYAGGKPNGVHHSFVCDGYKDGRYHMNWGWGGHRNCYVYLVSTETDDAIAPENDEDEEKISGYYDDQIAYTHIMPDNGGTMDANRKMLCYELSKVTYYDYTLRKEVNSTTFERTNNLILHGQFFNVCYRDRLYEYGIKASGTGGTYYLSCDNRMFNSSCTEIYFMNTILDDILATGEYTLTPIYKDLTAGDTEWKEMEIAEGVTKPVITITGENPYVYMVEQPQLTSNGQPLNGHVYKKDGVVDLNVSMKIMTLRDIKSSDNHKLCAFIFKEDGENSLDSICCDLGDIPANTTMTVDLTEKHKELNTIELGKKYFIQFTDVHGEKDNPAFDFIPLISYQTVNFDVIDPDAPVVEEDNNVCSIGTKNYMTVQDALKELQENDTIKITKDINLTSSICVSASMPAFTLDLNGHVLDGSNIPAAIEDGETASIIQNLGTLSIIDSDPESVHTGNLAMFNGAILTGGKGGNNIYQEGAYWSKYCGGAIFNLGTLSVTGCTIYGNTAVYGAGIMNDMYGTTTLTGCTIAGNTAYDIGGGVIAYDGKITMKHCNIYENKVESYGSGIYAAYGSITVDSCKIYSNTSSYNGGGAYCEKPGTIIFNGCEITGNHSTNRSGGIENLGKIMISDCTITGNTSNTSYRSAGITSLNPTKNSMLILMGKVIIKDNKSSDKDANLCLRSGNYNSYATLNGLKEGSEIGITTRDDNGDGAFKFTTNGTADDLKFFTSDNDLYMVEYNQEGYFELKDNPATVISSLETETPSSRGNTGIYDLNGRQHNVPAKGIMIINSKKVLK